MLRSLSLLVLSLCLPWSLMAAPNKALQSVNKKYQSAKLVEMDVEKTVTSDLLGKKTKHIGKIYLANGKFRWENSVPEESLLVFDGSIIWSVQVPPKEFGGPVQVLKGKVDKKNRSQILISSLLGEDLQKRFKVKKESKENSLLRLEVEPVGNDLTIKTLELVVDPKTSELKVISYKDEIGNLTDMAFSNIKFKDKKRNELFKYQPPKDAQVSDL